MPYHFVSFFFTYTWWTFQQRATFQCILATNGVQSFVFFLYGDLDVNDLSPQVGLNAGNGIDFISLDGSLTSDIYNINRESNLGCPGVFVFQVDGGIQQPQSKLQCTIPSCKLKIRILYMLQSYCETSVTHRYYEFMLFVRIINPYRTELVFPISSRFQHWRLYCI